MRFVVQMLLNGNNLPLKLFISVFFSDSIAGVGLDLMNFANNILGSLTRLPTICQLSRSDLEYQLRTLFENFVAFMVSWTLSDIYF